MEFTNGTKRKSSADLTNLVYGKVPPQARDLEQVILGAMMMDKNIVPIIMAKLFQDAFYVEAHQKIFKAVLNLYDKSKEVDMETVIYQLKANEDLESVGGPYALSQLTVKVTSTANLDAHISILLELYLKREAIKISADLMNDGYDDSTDAFDIVSRATDEFIKAQEKVTKGTFRDMSYYVMKVSQNRDRILTTGIIGLPSGFTEIDKVIGGWVNPDLIVIAARPGMGKSAMILSTVHNLSVKNNIPGALFSLEMSGEQMTERLESIDSDIFHEKLRKANLSDYDRRVLSDTENRIAKSPIYIEDRPGISIRDFRTKATLLKRKYGIKYIILDYLQLMRSADPRITSREQIISDISRGCKEVAKELEIPVIALSQLSRAVESRNDKMPQLSDLRESGSIEQDADEVLFLMRPEYYDFMEPVEIGGNTYDAKGLVIVKIDKNRHGPTQNIALRFDAPLMKYCNYEREAPAPPRLKQWHEPNENQFDENLPEANPF